jgi:membrane associated rhomboid family serine protease
MGFNVFVFLIQETNAEVLPPGFVPGEPTLWGLVASVFMHAGLMHLAGNMLFLWLFGTLAEDVFGPRLLLGLYFLSHLGAALLHTVVAAVLAPEDLSRPCVGASGAIAGLMGLSAVCFLRAKVRVWYVIGWYFHWRMDVVEIGAPVAVGLWAGWELVQGSLWTGLGIPSGAAHWAHVGGFAVGLAAALALRLRRRVVYADLVEGRRPTTTQTEAYAQGAELEAIVAKTPQDGEAWYSLGRAREIGGRGPQAVEAYLRSLETFLKQRQAAGAVKAFEGVREHVPVSQLPRSVLFPLASALEDEGRNADACEVFRQVATASPGSPEAETALARAAEMAMGLSDNGWQAAECYRALLRDFPYSRWRPLAESRLRDIGTVAPPPQAQPEERAGVSGFAPTGEAVTEVSRRAVAEGAERPDGLRRLGEGKLSGGAGEAVEGASPGGADQRSQGADRRIAQRPEQEGESVSRFDRLERLPRKSDEETE